MNTENAQSRVAHQWFIVRADKEEGPYTDADLHRMLDAGAIDADTFAYKPGLPDWVRLRDTALHDQPRLKDSWIIALALLLLAVALFAMFIDPSFRRFIPFIAGAALYFIPTYVAHCRTHHQFPAICALNILLGWTFIGWAVALIWALIKPSKIAS